MHCSFHHRSVHGDINPSPYSNNTKSRKDKKGNNVLTWHLPLKGGAVPHVSFEDCGPYVRERANGIDLQVAIALLTTRK